MNSPRFSSSPRAWLLASLVALLVPGCGDDPTVEPEPEPPQEENSLHQPPAETEEARYDLPENPGSSVSEPVGHCLVLAGFDKDQQQLFFSDPADNLRTGHQLSAKFSPHPVRFVRNYLTTVINDTPATVFGAVLVQPPDRNAEKSARKWMQTGMPDLSQHASPAWQNFCAPTSAANLMLFFSARHPQLHPRKMFLEKVEGDSSHPFVNRSIAGFERPLPKPDSLAYLMGTSTEDGTTGLGVRKGTEAYLRQSLGPDGGKWQVRTILENMESPDGMALYQDLCTHCGAGDGILLFILWGLPTDGGGGAGGGTDSSAASSRPADGGQQGAGDDEPNGAGQASGTESSSDGSSSSSPGGTPVPEQDFPEEQDPSRFLEPEVELEDRPAVIVDDFLLEERSGLWYKKGQSKPFTGKARRSYPSGKTLLEIPYLNGRRHGTQIIWSESGEVQRRVEWRDGKAIR